MRTIIHLWVRTGCLATVLVAFCVSAGARDYFVSLGGDDANPGTRPKPWQTIARVNRTAYNAGDRILFEGGQSFVGNLVLDDQSKTASGHPITIGSSGQGRATLRAGDGTGILVRNIGGIIIRDLVVAGNNHKTNQGSGIKVVNENVHTRLEFVRIENLEAHGFRWEGIYVGALPPDLLAQVGPSGGRHGFRDVEINHCIAYDNMYFGIYVSGIWDPKSSTYANEMVSISDCLAHDNPGDPAFTQNHSGNGILLDSTNEGLIERCVAYHNGFANAGQTGGPCGIWTHASNRVAIQFCESYSNRTAGAADGGGFDFDGGVTNSVMQYNYSHDNDGAGYLVWNYQGAPHHLRNNILRYNISENDGRKHRYGAFHIGTDGEPVRDIEVYNNTVYTSTAPGGLPRSVWLGQRPNQNIDFHNNLLISSGGPPLLEIEKNQTGIVFQGNAYWSTTGECLILYEGETYTSLDTWRKATGQEQLNGKPVGVWADPRISHGGENETIGFGKSRSGLLSFRLLSDSPLIDRGIDLKSRFEFNVGAQDFWGTLLPQGKGFDIGAHEFKP